MTDTTRSSSIVASLQDHRWCLRTRTPAGIVRRDAMTNMTLCGGANRVTLDWKRTQDGTQRGVSVVKCGPEKQCRCKGADVSVRRRIVRSTTEASEEREADRQMQTGNHTAIKTLASRPAAATPPAATRTGYWEQSAVDASTDVAPWEVAVPLDRVLSSCVLRTLGIPWLASE